MFRPYAFKTALKVSSVFIYTSVSKGSFVPKTLNNRYQHKCAGKARRSKVDKKNFQF